MMDAVEVNHSLKGVKSVVAMNFGCIGMGHPLASALQMSQ
jgi:hypothetical protein